LYKNFRLDCGVERASTLLLQQIIYSQGGNHH
jgi:hypothetical protein